MMLDRAILYHEAFKQIVVFYYSFHHWSDYPTANLYFRNGKKEKTFDKYWINSSEDDYDTFTFVVILDPQFTLSFLTYYYEKIFEDETEAVMNVHVVKSTVGKLLKEYDPKTHAEHETSLESSSNFNIKSLSRNQKCKFDFLL
ncbi:hypothetical protein GQ457_03G012760 [Hibiscus cannabinus]